MVSRNIIKPYLLLFMVLSGAGCNQLYQKTDTPAAASGSQAGSEQSVVAEANQMAAAQQTPVVFEEIAIAQYEKKTIPVIDAWQRARHNFRLDIGVNNRRTRVQRDWYAKHQDYMDRIARRATRYLFHVVEELERREMPGELALLPIVESAYDPFAYSHGRASGMWQFIPGTGKRYKLKQDWWYDGRRDVVESTRAALDYLDYLHDRFDGDWLHALAAYNSGEGNVRKAIRINRAKGKSTDFWSLKLPRETQAYVPKLLALAQLLADTEKYGLVFPPIPNRPYFARVATGGQIDLAQAAELADITLDELYLLNPGYNQWATSPREPYLLNVPVAKADTFAKNLTALPSEKRISWLRYRIRNGDSLIKIANRHNTTAQALRQVNGLKSNRIRAGKTLFIPIASKSSDHYVHSAAQRLNRKQESPANSGKIKKNHIVRSGDNFWDLSRKYGVGMRELARWNGMATRDRLRIGQKLVVWIKPAADAQQIAANTLNNDRKIIRKIGYRVRSGDSLARIAQKFNISISDIEGWNSISRKKYLQPGQSLKLYVDITRASL